MEVNVLITSVSRKVWLVKAFKAALQRQGVNGNIVAVDVNPLSAAFYLSDKYYCVPPSSEPSFIPTILDICRKENVRLLIPTRDDELLLFARNKNTFETQGTCVMVSPPEVIETCRDKYKFYQFLTENDVSTPKTYLPDLIDFSGLDSCSLLIKPRYGAGSNSMFKIRNYDKLSWFVNYVTDPLVQEFVGGKEYTIDLFSDFNSKVITVVPRERIEIVSGESYKGITVEDTKMIEQAKYLAEKLGTIGHITIQCIKDTDVIKFIEVNPRFGGGSILGIMAGADTPSLLLESVQGKTLQPHIGEYKKGLIMLRYTEDIFIADGQTVPTNDSRTYA